MDMDAFSKGYEKESTTSKAGGGDDNHRGFEDGKGKDSRKRCGDFDEIGNVSKICLLIKRFARVQQRKH